MKVLLFGKTGQVGRALCRVFPAEWDVSTLGRDDADFSRSESLKAPIKELRPDIIINAAAYTAVDLAEEQEEVAMAINGIAPGVLAEEAARSGALLVHYSTDYVFDGTKEGPYLETDVPKPINAYGRTKRAGEQAIQSSGCDYLIFRASWVYSPWGHNFLLTMLRLFREREELSIVDDQVGSPTSAGLIADLTLRCLKVSMQDKRDNSFSSDLYHLSASGCTSWFGFSNEILKMVSNMDRERYRIKNIIAVSSDEYRTPAMRPKNSRLSTSKLCNKFVLTMPDWRDVLEECMADL